MVRVDIPLEHDILFIVHADLLRYMNGASVRRIDHGNQSFEAQYVKGKIAYRARSFCSVAVSPGRTDQAIANLHFCLSGDIWKEEQATVPNHIPATLLNYCIWTKPPRSIIAFKTSTQPSIYPFSRLDAIAKTHHFGISKDAIDRLTIQNVEVTQHQSVCCQSEHRSTCFAAYLNGIGVPCHSRQTSPSGLNSETIK